VTKSTARPTLSQQVVGSRGRQVGLAVPRGAIDVHPRDVTPHEPDDRVAHAHQAPVSLRVKVLEGAPQQVAHQRRVARDGLPQQFHQAHLAQSARRVAARGPGDELAEAG